MNSTKQISSSKRHSWRLITLHGTAVGLVVITITELPGCYDIGKEVSNSGQTNTTDPLNGNSTSGGSSDDSVAAHRFHENYGQTAYSQTNVLGDATATDDAGLKTSETNTDSKSPDEIRNSDIQSGEKTATSVRTITSGVLVDKVVFDESFTQFKPRNLVTPLPLETIRPANPENHFVFVLVKVHFPKGKVWSISAFRLTDSANREYDVKAFNFGEIPSQHVLYLADKGALGIWSDEKKCATHLIDTTDTYSPRPGTVTFPIGNWPDGSNLVWHAFETPKEAVGLVIDRRPSVARANNKIEDG